MSHLLKLVVNSKLFLVLAISALSIALTTLRLFFTVIRGLEQRSFKIFEGLISRLYDLHLRRYHNNRTEE